MRLLCFTLALFCVTAAPVTHFQQLSEERTLLQQSPALGMKTLTGTALPQSALKFWHKDLR